MRVLLVVYDNGSHVHTFPQGTAYIAGALRFMGHEVVIWNQDVSHWPDESLTFYLDSTNRFDMVGLGFIGGYWQYQRMKGLSKAINASQNRPTLFVLGGHGPSPAPEYFLKVSGADVVVVGEGERTIQQVASDYILGQNFENLPGIAYLKDGHLIQNEPRKLMDMFYVGLPAYDLFPVEYYRLADAPLAHKTDFVMPVASGRGCPYRCNFCYRMDPGYRPRPVEHIVREIAYLQYYYGITYIDFSDELLMTSEARVREICNELKKMGIRWTCNGRLNIATKELLQVMKDAGCVFINYGVECFDDQVLKNMNKHLTCEQIVRGVENTKAVELAAGLNMIWGNIGDNLRTLDQSVAFLVKYADTSHLRTIRPVTPYPGTDLFAYAVSKGLLKDVEDFYESKHKNSDFLAVNFTDLTDDRFHEALRDANTVLIREHYNKVMDESIESVRRLYDQKDYNFRGFRQM